MENNQVPDDTPTDVETPVRQRSPTRNTYMSRLVGIGQSINQTTRRLQFDPDMQQGLAAQLSASFNRASPIRNRETAPVRVRGRGGRVQGGRGRRSQELQIRLVCIRRPERSSSNISYQELREYGLGNASTADERGVCVIPIDWTEESFRQYIEEAFPVLRSTQYEARRSERGGRLVRLETLIPSDLRNVFLAGRDRIRNPPTVFITPLEEIHHRTMDTPTVMARVSSGTNTQPPSSSSNHAVQSSSAPDHLTTSSDDQPSISLSRQPARSPSLQPQLASQAPSSTPHQTDQQPFSLPHQPEQESSSLPHQPDQSPSPPFHHADQTLSSSLHHADQTPSSPLHHAGRPSSSPLHQVDQPPSLPLHQVDQPPSSPLQHADQPPSSPHHPADQSRNSPPHQLQQEQQRTNIYVRRQAVVEDLTTVFQDDNLVTSGVRVEVLGEDAVDENGVFRDVLTEFWGCLFGSAAFEGGDQAAPHPDANTTPAMWKAIGNILIVGYLQVGYLPVRFAVASLAWAMFGTVSEGTLLKSWLHSLDGVDRAMMKTVLHRGLKPDDREAVVDILDRFRITSLPSPRNIRNLCIRAAHLLFVESAAFPLLRMNIKRLRQTVPRLEDLLEIRRALKPDGQRVARMIYAEVTSARQQEILEFLVRSVRTMDSTTINRFVRFVSGSDAITFRTITVQFVRMSGIERRFVAHTCGIVLDVPITYTSYNEFNNELRTQLSSGHWEMNFA